MTGIHQLLFTNFAAGGIATGEGELNASGGNETKTIGLYKYHVFTASGDFTVTGGGDARVIAIGGGGGGGQDASGGGGAGEVDNFQELLTFDNSTTYKILIGAGNLASGSNTTISAGGTNLVISLGGGEGGNFNTVGANGGSGGGGGASVRAGGSASGNNTNTGGTGGPNTSPFGGGGGGGATQVGKAFANGATHSAGSEQVGGAGGEGIALTAVDTNLAFANFSSFTEANSGIVASGGGAGSNKHGGYDDTSVGTCAQGGTGGGIGGKANGATTNRTATDGTSFGSGGGGAGFNSGNGSGADGLVIIRYAA